MKKFWIVFVIALPVVFISSCDTSPVYPSLEETAKSVIKLEKEALENWSAGNPGEFPIHMADDVTYMDDIMASELKKGLESVDSYLNSLEGMIPPHEFELVDPFVQQYNSVAILTFHYVGSVDGQKGQPWKATSIYNYADGEWKMVHANWSLVKQPGMEPSDEEQDSIEEVN